jgi:hypothetical protein
LTEAATAIAMAAPAISLAIRHPGYPELIGRTGGMQPTRSPNSPAGAQQIVALSRALTRRGTVGRLAILPEDGTLARTGRWSELLVVIERHGDRSALWSPRASARLVQQCIRRAGLDPRPVWDLIEARVTRFRVVGAGSPSQWFRQTIQRLRVSQHGSTRVTARAYQPNARSGSL